MTHRKDLLKEIQEMDKLKNNKAFAALNYDTIGTTTVSSSKKVLMPINERYNRKKKC